MDDDCLTYSTSCGDMTWEELREYREECLIMMKMQEDEDDELSLLREYDRAEALRIRENNAEEKRKQTAAAAAKKAELEFLITQPRKLRSHTKKVTAQVAKLH